MTHEETRKLLNEYFDEKLSVEVNDEIKLHIGECDDCGQYFFSLQDLSKKAGHLPTRIKPPTTFWPDIFASISDIKTETMKQKKGLELIEAEQTRHETEEEKWKCEERVRAEQILEWERKKATFFKRFSKRKVYRIAFSLIVMIILFLIYNFFFTTVKAWKVKKIHVESNTAVYFSTLAEGEIVESNPFIRLEIEIPKVGEIFLEPSTKIRRLKPLKIYLEQGTIYVKEIDDASKFLTVGVPGAEISDYSHGNKYKINLNNLEETTIEVEHGYVAVKNGNSESLVLPRHSCKITANGIVGLPYINGSNLEFISAINDYCYNSPGNEESLVEILTMANVSNSVTLWNLLNRVNLKQRETVVYKIIGLLGELPKGVTVEGLKTLDKLVMQKLIEEIELRIQ